MKRSLVLLALVFVFVTALAGCGNSGKGTSTDQGSSASAAPTAGASTEASATPADSAAPATAEAGKLAEIKKAGKIVLGTSADYPPYEFHKKVDGKDTIVGFDVMIAEEIAKQLGVKLEIKDVAFDGLLPALAAGQADFVISGMTPTKERKKNVDFSKIYYRATQAVIVREEDKDAFKTMESLNGKEIGAQTASTQADIAKTQVKDAKVKELGSVMDLILQLKTKKVDAIIVEEPVAKAYIAKTPGLVLAEAKPKDDVGGSAIAFKKGNEALVEEVNKIVDKLVADKKIDQFVDDASKLMAEE